ncbi:MAG: HD domain-containing phosphohydrolase [Candidatus Sedimenticola endophacoides]
MFKSAPLHDIGKVGVPDTILKKTGPLTEEESMEMKRHIDYGLSAIRKAEQEHGSTEFLNMAKEIVWTHHERWDGSGYPRGLRGDQIPVAGRLMALADVYDALTHKRVYKEIYSHQVAMEWIEDKRGTHFNPLVVEAFLAREPDFLEITERYKDG